MRIDTLWNRPHNDSLSTVVSSRNQTCSVRQLYEQIEIELPCEYNRNAVSFRDVSRPIFILAPHAIELRTSRKLPVIREKKAEENRWVEKFKFPVKTKESWWVETHRFSCAPWGYTVDVVKVGENDTMVDWYFDPEDAG